MKLRTEIQSQFKQSVPKSLPFFQPHFSSLGYLAIAFLQIPATVLCQIKWYLLQINRQGERPFALTKKMCRDFNLNWYCLEFKAESRSRYPPILNKKALTRENFLSLPDPREDLNY